jgi:regulatory protein
MEDWQEQAEGEPPRSHSEVERALDIAYRTVARRERTVAELRTCLERKRVEPPAIDQAVDALTEAGFLDDARYARRFAEDKRELEQWGSERIGRDLQRRGIASDLIEAAVSDRPRGAEIETALLLLDRRVGAPLRDDRDRERAWRMLVRRGYATELAYEAIRSWERNRMAEADGAEDGPDARAAPGPATLDDRGPDATGSRGPPADPKPGHARRAA